MEKDNKKVVVFGPGGSKIDNESIIEAVKDLNMQVDSKPEHEEKLKNHNLKEALTMLDVVSYNEFRSPEPDKKERTSKQKRQRITFNSVNSRDNWIKSNAKKNVKKRNKRKAAKASRKKNRRK